MARPSTKPLLTVLRARRPVRGGARVTRAPGIGAKTLLVAGALYSCAVIVTVVPTKESANVVLKVAEMPVMVPARGVLNAN